MSTRKTIEELKEENKIDASDIKAGDFNNLSKFDYEGVYIICDKDDYVVYIGSAYARTIEKRLNQYISPKDTGNTLGKTIAKRLAGEKTYNDAAKARMDDAVRAIKEFSVYAIEHKDLEYKLIKSANPEYNNNGKDED